MKKFCTKYLKYIFLFLGFLFFNLILSPMSSDEVWCFGFSYNIVKGAIPYLDYNMVITPLYPFLMAFFLFLFGNNIIVFHIMNALLITLLFAILFSLLGKKSWILLPFFIAPYNLTFPDYNFLLLFFFFLFLYGEEKKWPDFVMGVIIGLFFLTKQSVGGIFLLSVFMFWKNKKRMLNRIAGFCVPNVFFFLYLLITKSLLPFLDLCFFGLFDFGSGNGSLMNIFCFFSIVFCILLIYLIRKNPKHTYYWYCLLFGSICLPLFDWYHATFFYLACVAVILFYHDFPFLKYTLIGACLTIGFLGLYCFSFEGDGKYPNSIPRFEYRYLEKRKQNFTSDTLKVMKKYDNKVMFIGPNGYYFKIILNEKITYFDLINTGNWGYHGSDKLLNKVKELDDDVVFFVSKGDFQIGKQTDRKLVSYIFQNGQKIDETKLYDVYQLIRE